LAAIRGHGLLPDQMLQLKNAPFPILSIVGDEDILIVPTHSYKMVEQLGAKLVTIKGAGHGVMGQCPFEVNSALKLHFESVDVGSSSSSSSTTTTTTTTTGVVEPSESYAIHKAQVEIEAAGEVIAI